MGLNLTGNKLTWGIIISLVFAFVIREGCNKGGVSEQDFETLMEIHVRDSTELAIKNNQLGQATITAEAFELSQEALSKYVQQSDEMKGKLANVYGQINSLNTTIASFKKDTIRIPVPHGDTLPCGDIDKSYPVVDPNKYYSFDFKFKNKRGHEPEFYFLNFNIPDTVTDVIGVKKDGFLNMRRTLVSEQVHTNKYIQVKGVKTIVKKEAKPKTLKKVAKGFVMGVIATIFVQSKLKNK